MKWRTDNPPEEKYYHTKGTDLYAYWHNDKKEWSRGGITQWLDESETTIEEQEIEALKRFSSLYEQSAIDRDKYKALILKAFEWASPLSKNGKIYKIKLRMFEKENNIEL